MKLFLDDERQEPEGWLLVRSAKYMIALIDSKKVTHISLDHDLGDESVYGTGYDVLNHIEKQVANGKIKELPVIKIHTANISARKKMELALQSIKKIYYNNIPNIIEVI